jgi:hypothetical protein
VQEVAPLHTMLKMSINNTVSPDSQCNLCRRLTGGGIYFNPTANQYGYEPEFATVSSYPGTLYRTHEIGFNYIEYLKHIHGVGTTDCHVTRRTLLENEARTCTVNNSFHCALGELGGPLIFSNVDTLPHEVAIRRLVENMAQDVESLRHSLFEIYRHGAIGLETRLSNLVRQCEGPGHSAIIEQLERD